MKQILLFGAGKSATVLIEYLKDISTTHQWQIVVADSNLETVQLKVGKHDFVEAVQVDITNETERKNLVQNAQVVISMMPPSLHYLIALDCIEFSKHLLTASYVDDKIKLLSEEIKNKGLLFLCEMGLDPGIDHMSAMQLIHRIKDEGGKITSFKSHCGGLVAPESDNNPWHYKISWNPRNIILAGKAGAVYKENNQVISVPYEELFDGHNIVAIDKNEVFAYYPNRDSLSYMPLYDLEESSTFIRTTLRHPDFSFGWEHIINLMLTDETPFYKTDGLTVAAFFDQHIERFGLHELYEDMVMYDSLLKEQFNFLGLKTDATIINKGLCSAADVLQFILERRLLLQPADKDMIVMLHEIEWEKLNGERSIVKSSLVVKGEDSLHTAMAKTVGLPLGIAAKLILEHKLTITGLHIPIIPEIYTPVLNELMQNGIRFNEITQY
jgi:saccharopine dehydrogenase-like NADP-dependent oxidoreductase